MLEIGNGEMVDPGRARIQFALWSAMKSPLILGTPLPKLSPALLAIVSTADVIAVNQDALGVQAKKLLAGGAPTPRFVGLAPCDAAPGARGANGVSAASLAWTQRPSAAAGRSASSRRALPAGRGDLAPERRHRAGLDFSEAPRCDAVPKVVSAVPCATPAKSLRSESTVG
jgi:hypothetical protein